MDYAYAALAGVVIIVFLSFRRPKLGHIPTLGYSTPLLSYITAFKFRTHSRDMIEEGYRKYPNQVWKLSTLDGWFIVANGTHRVEEMNKASGKELSAILNFQSYLQLDYTLGPEVTTNPYHIKVVRSTMTRNVAAQFEDMHSEAVSAFEDLISSNSLDWHAIPIFSSMSEIISRINARLAVGYPLCQNKAFRDLCGRSSPVLMKGRHLRFVPSFLRPIAAKLIVNSGADIGAMARHLQPVIAHRLNEQRLHGSEWAGKPNDTLMWMMDEAEKSGERVTAYGMATRLYFLTFASDGIAMVRLLSSHCPWDGRHPDLPMQMLSCALYEVATRPEYIKPLRDEVEAVVAWEDWVSPFCVMFGC
ncbi:hypothetical protein BJ912DRAFT_672003 [Pholiota molesta]|nr:hypothetical protein BJ912DRAFT_672003 [Pholiota molesta]